MNTPKNISDLRLLQATGVKLSFRFFLDYQPVKNAPLTNACLSQWWPCFFTVDGNIFTTAEHFMMYQKAQLFGDRETAARIVDADHPFEAKMLGRQVKKFDEVRWNAARFDIVVQGNVEKFSQNQKLLKFLIDTDDAIITETSPTDLIWGSGCHEDDPRASQPENWPGQNLLGFALMAVRERLTKTLLTTRRH